jgi:hypothetical protein
LTISTQSVGIVAMAVMAATGLAVAADVLSQRSVSERMLYYQAEALAMDVEIMWDWGEGSSVEKDFRRKYNEIEKTSDRGRDWIILSSDEKTMKAPVNTEPGSLTIQDDLENFNCIYLNKTGSNSIEILGPSHGVC